MFNCSPTPPQALSIMFTFLHSEINLTRKFSPPPCTRCLLHMEDLKLCLHSSDLNGLFTQLCYAY